MNSEKSVDLKEVDTTILVSEQSVVVVSNTSAIRQSNCESERRTALCRTSAKLH